MISTLALLAIGIALLTTLTTDTSRFVVTIFMFLVGLGIGASFSELSNAAIHGFTARQRGSASSTLSFTRELGITLGITEALSSSIVHTFAWAIIYLRNKIKVLFKRVS